jgi:hypothetical protein
MSPDAAIGTISVRDASGVVLHDGTSADITTLDRGGALAVVIAPGPALDRLAPFPGMATTVQRRDCAPGQCGAAGECLTDPPRLTAKCHPANYLDKGPEGRHGGEDNADFVDRNDAAGRTRNTNGFINGPVAAPEGRTAVNDRLTVIAYRDVMPRVMRRVALEVAQCLAQYAARPENTGRYPSPTPTCRQDLTDPSASWADAPHVVFGRVPDTPFTRTRMASGGTMLERWWRHTPRTPETFDDLPTRDHACRIAFEPDDTGTVRSLAAGAPPEEGRTAGLSENAWWNAWKPFVFYALAPAFRAENARAECGGALPCLDVVDRTNAVVARAKHFAVIVAGPPLALSSSPQRHGNGLAATDDWLEGPNARIERANPNPAAPECPMDLFRAACSDNACLKAMQASANAAFNDVVVAHPRN